MGPAGHEPMVPEQETARRGQQARWGWDNGGRLT